ncbi:DNA topoisomerase I [Ectothiorhodospira variabilis]|uniref:DNA topoisomerase I n=1 Tax=Ectothiorhodospira variabilis TaxID=505694 RepID=UPI001EFAF1D2|nr:DNA topoisomerase I [Ectothiorhodospira variabilis]MCG5494261.1 DNA topoisomerase I [Ectothiorhodospira variabilis]MCG5504793.1 DNA topoisomerase I [Ectothiorhodospira variabilis]MCG5507950.1 DNA topoisomerase I [Ectothiorhodospira variabilis]
MSKHLVIVESPAKAKTIKKYLGNDFEVLASYGHVRDLVPKEGAVDTEDGFRMNYQVIERNEKHVESIARALKKADSLILATDPDREGEAISWHLYELLNERGLLKDKDAQRVVFHEITQRAVREAIEHPRGLSNDLINAQQARRALDYLVGFNLSPLLWKKIKRGLSAGRVQSPALRMIVEREQEIEAFVSQEYWTVDAHAAKDAEGFTARLQVYAGKKLEQFDINNEADAQKAREILLSSANGRLHVAKVEKKQRRRNPAAPFTTSTLQQEASRKLGFSASRTMRVAQQLYEGIDLGSGPIGLITYMRTDSFTLSNDAIQEIRGLIEERYGKQKVPDSPRIYKTKSKNAQEAHEAIRPTSVQRLPDEVKSHLSQDQARLYDLVWKRTVACQMIHATLDTVAADLQAGSADHVFRATGSSVRDPGFMAVYREDQDDTKVESDERLLPELKEGEDIDLRDVQADQHFTEPPPRYSEASLVKALEEHGIGRPSTYASIISTLLQREYAELVNRRFIPTDIGRIVNTFLTQHFTQYVDYDFTARLEDELDEISRGEKEWVPVMERFWDQFHEQVKEKDASVTREEAVQAREIGTDPKSGRPVSVRMGRYGPFVQIGTKDDEEKPRFAGLRPGQKMDSITMDEAMALFKLPRELGETPEGEPVLVNIGRFGPYVKFGDRYASLKKEDDPYTIELPRALELVAEKKEIDANRFIKTFEEEGIQVLNGRYGPYITNGAKNARIPKDQEPKDLTLEQCQELLAAAPEKKGRGRKAPAKKAATKKAATTKKTTTKASTTKKASKASSDTGKTATKAASKSTTKAKTASTSKKSTGSGTKAKASTGKASTRQGKKSAEDSTAGVSSGT